MGIASSGHRNRSDKCCLAGTAKDEDGHVATLVLMKTPAADRPAQGGRSGSPSENGDDVTARNLMTPVTWELERPLRTVVRSLAHR